jgi:hypothetical protein
MVGCLQGKTRGGCPDKVNKLLIGLFYPPPIGRWKLEATPGIEPGFADLQSAASPLRHVAPYRFSVGKSGLGGRRGLYQMHAPNDNKSRQAACCQGSAGTPISQRPNGSGSHVQLRSPALQYG